MLTIYYSKLDDMKKQLASVITENVNDRLNEMKLKAVIKSMLREYIESEFGDMEETKSDDNEKSDDVDDEPKTDDNKDNKQKKDEKPDKDDPETEELISSIEKYFKNPGVKQAPFAYKLGGIKQTSGKDTEEMKNERSKFAKKVNHELNDSGYPYQFSPEEAIRLKSLISAQELSEVKKWEKRMLDATTYKD